MSEYDAWIGRETRASDRLDEALAARWLATFDLPMPQPAFMPQGIHFALCTPDAATAALGEDGHPARDESDASFFPPVPLPRRMWAASDIEFHAPIPLGSAINRTSTVAAINEKEGKSGKLAFVEVDHETYADDRLAVRERQALVFRDAAAPNAPLSPPELGEAAFDPGEWDAHRTITPSTALLFRYSALTFNTHRIHYDAAYAREAERYRGLVVHGPLTASLLLRLAARVLGENVLTRFEFRGVSPAIAGEKLHCAMRADGGAYEMGAFAVDGRQVMKARAEV